MKKLSLAIIMILMMSSVVALAQGVGIQATVSQNKVALGQAFKLEIAVQGASIDKLDLPALNGFDIQYVGPSRRVTIINGVSTSTISFNYTVFPKQTGNFTIPSLQINVDGQAYRSDPINIEVVDASTGLSTDGTTLDDKLFIKVDLKKKNVFVGEQVPINIRLYVADVSMQDVELPVLDSLGFAMDDFQAPAQYTQTINGLQYRVVDFNTNIYPTRTGAIDIGPISISGNILHEQSNQDPFGGRIFGGFFNSYQKQPIKMQSPAVSLNVNDLPVENKPDHFSGAVGQFNFNASVGPTDVRVGDPLTLKMNVSGTGDLRAISFPAFNDKRFKTYEPQIKQEAGVKSLEQVIIPTSTDIKDVPAITFHYFNPITQTYESVTRGPFLVNVGEAQGGEEFKMVGFDQAVPQLITKEEKFGRDIIFIKDDIGSIHKRNKLFFGSVLFYIIVIGYVLLWCAAFVYLKFRQKLGRDPYFARRIKAFKKAKKELAKIHSSSPQACQQLYEVLKNYFSDRYQLPRGEISHKELTTFLEQHQADQKIIDKMTLILNACDEIRFSGQQGDIAVNQFLSMAKELLDYCQENVS